MQIFQQLAGYSLGQADMVRRAMSKKKAKDIAKEQEASPHHGYRVLQHRQVAQA